MSIYHCSNNIPQDVQDKCSCDRVI